MAIKYKGFEINVQSMPIKEYYFPELIPDFIEANSDVEDERILNIMHITEHRLEYLFVTEKYPTKEEIKKTFDVLEEYVRNVNDKEESDENL